MIRMFREIIAFRLLVYCCLSSSASNLWETRLQETLGYSIEGLASDDEEDTGDVDIDFSIGVSRGVNLDRSDRLGIGEKEDVDVILFASGSAEWAKLDKGEVNEEGDRE